MDQVKFIEEGKLPSGWVSYSLIEVNGKQLMVFEDHNHKRVTVVDVTEKV